MPAARPKGGPRRRRAPGAGAYLGAGENATETSRVPQLVAKALRFLLPGTNFLVQNRRRDDAVVEVAQIELLVRRVSVLVWQADAEEHRRQAQLLLKRRDHRNRAPFAGEDGRASESLFDGSSGCL